MGADVPLAGITAHNGKSFKQEKFPAAATAAAPYAGNTGTAARSA